MREYKIVEAKSTFALEEKIKTYLGMGWVPEGGVTFSYYGTGEACYLQAVVRGKSVWDKDSL